MKKKKAKDKLGKTVVCEMVGRRKLFHLQPNFVVRQAAKRGSYWQFHPQLVLQWLSSALHCKLQEKNFLVTVP